MPGARTRGLSSVPNPQYERGKRFENKCKEWFAKIADCERSFMSGGADLKILRGLRFWKVSCKKFKRENIPSLAKLLAELEGHDFVAFGMDRDVPYCLSTLPKFVEFCNAEKEPE